jgi:polyhydroxyalkanoate synthase
VPDQPPPPVPTFDAERMSKAWADFAQRGQRIVQGFLDRPADDLRIPDPAIIAKAFVKLGAKLLANPGKLSASQAQFVRDYASLMQAMAGRARGKDVPPVVKPGKGDRRFADDGWEEGVLFDFIKQSYLLSANWIQSTVRGVEGLDPKTARKVDFYTRQFVDALSPSNFAATNPMVLRATLESGGENLMRGLDNLLGDLEKDRGKLRITMTDESAFELGRNIAVSSGKVVFRNRLLELIQYAPSTDRVLKRPLLIVPHWINKYYVLDLQPRNSFIKWVVDRGHTVFVISWVNPDETHAETTFDDYMTDGPLAALDAVAEATGVDSVNVVGYCIGGTLLACTLAHMAATGDKRAKTATFLTTMVDFAEPGEHGVFIDDEQLDLMEAHMARRGFLDGAHMSTVINMMRDKDLIWSFVINNYLMGRDPLSFDLLYWNSDSTRMPAMMHAFYLRKLYLENKLIDAGGITLAGTPIDLGKIETPAYIMATREDHIAPWQSAYAATGLTSGPVRFVLAASGHIAGVVNPPAAGKYCHWTNPNKPKSADSWLASAERREGSWWPDWDRWVKRRSPKGRVAARIPGRGGLKAIEDAPGSYVKVRSTP